MFVGSFKLFPFEKSSFRRSIVLFVDKMSMNLQTGSGKSLIFHMVPLVHAWLFGHSQDTNLWKKDGIILVISPSLTLMQDQVKMLTDCGLRAAYVGGEKIRKVAPQHREREVFLRLRLARICLIKRKVVVDADKRGIQEESHWDCGT